MATAGRRSPGFGAGYAPAFGLPITLIAYGTQYGVGPDADYFVQSGSYGGPRFLPATQHSHFSSRPTAAVSAGQCCSPHVLLHRGQTLVVAGDVSSLRRCMLTLTFGVCDAPPEWVSELSASWYVDSHVWRFEAPPE